MAGKAPTKSDGFDLYDVKLRLSGSMLNEVRKLAITAPEAMAYASIHGPDSLPEVKATGDKADRSDREERARLAGVFETDPSKKGFVTNIFGPSTMQLPRTIPEDFQVDHAIAIGSDTPADLAAMALTN